MVLLYEDWYLKERFNKLGARAKTQCEWWRGAVIYQIYPRSFLDTNGDGVGDLRGCIRKLEYIASLGVDAIWLSPFFKSPMCDFGYDVSDYYNVDPLFGVLDDFDELVEQSHSKNIKIVIDQVYSHTSDQHEWFTKSRSNRTNAKSDWYVWADPKPDGSPPNNWQSVFGGGAWEWDNTRRQYYLHNFLACQPDLNVHKPEVQDALLAVAKFWLDRGVDGFRLDAINFAMHDPGLRDNPPAQLLKSPPTRPFDFQEHVHNQSHPGIVKFLEKLRRLTTAYPGDRFTVAEVVGPTPLREMKDFISGSTRLCSAYNFDYLYADEITPSFVEEATTEWATNDDDGWPSWAFSNHDAPRAVSRWSNADTGSQQPKLFAMLLMSLRGTIFLYQGEELGLPQAKIPFERLQDPEAIANWPETLGRDGARSPMPWSPTEPFAGFSTHAPWLPIDERHLDLAADLQSSVVGSTLNFVRDLIQLRRDNPSLRTGDIEFLNGPEGLLAFTRSDAEDVTLCVFNLTERAITWAPPHVATWEVEIFSTPGREPQKPGKSKLKESVVEPFSGFIASRVC